MTNKSLLTLEEVKYMFKSKFNVETNMDLMKARIWLGVIILLFWLFLITGAAVTFPFVGNLTRKQNIVYGLIVSIPFLTIVNVYLAIAFKDFKSVVSEKKNN